MISVVGRGVGVAAGGNPRVFDLAYRLCDSIGVWGASEPPTVSAITPQDVIPRLLKKISFSEIINHKSSNPATHVLVLSSAHHSPVYCGGKVTVGWLGSPKR